MQFVFETALAIAGGTVNLFSPSPGRSLRTRIAHGFMAMTAALVLAALLMLVGVLVIGAVQWFAASFS